MSRHIDNATLYALALAVVWGIAYPLTKMAEVYASPIVITLARIAAASAILVPLVRRVVVNARMFISAALNMGLFLVLLNTSILFSSNPGLAALMVYTQPLFVALFEPILLKTRPRPLKVAGVLLGFVGIAIASANSFSRGLDLGVLLGLAAGLLWGLGTVLYSMWFKGNIDPLVSNASSSLLSLPIALAALPIDLSIDLTLRAILLIIVVVLDAQIIGFMLWFKAVSSGDPGTVSSILLATPIIALYASALMIGSPVTTIEVAGSLITIIGLLIVVRFS